VSTNIHTNTFPHQTVPKLGNQFGGSLHLVLHRHNFNSQMASTSKCYIDTICICKRPFASFPALNLHQRTCQAFLLADEDAILAMSSVATVQRGQKAGIKRTLPAHLERQNNEPIRKKLSLMERLVSKSRMLRSSSSHHRLYHDRSAVPL
jgi:hypothetical protein